MLKNGDLTYVSLFSSAGVGCYGFLQEGYTCIATAELLSRRMAVQRCNHKCQRESGYIVGDLSERATKQRVLDEIAWWKGRGNDAVDVLMATPPCQGISVVNHKKTDKEIIRNSLVVESVELIKHIRPRFFIIENVAGFLKAACVDSCGTRTSVGDLLRKELSDCYVMYDRVLNFMNYGSGSSRTRTLVVGMSTRYKNDLSPLELYPAYRQEPTLREVIGSYRPLEWGEIDEADFYHAFRIYRASMRDWIRDLKQGESAFDNKDPEKRPHHYKNGVRVENVRKTRDKYTRQLWDRFAQCVTTRNDQLAAQNTIHPEQDRVLSIRELMGLMSVPQEFRWVDASLDELNALSADEKRAVYRQHEMNIRQCLGEAVPTEVMRQIACAIKGFLNRRPLRRTDCVSEDVGSFGPEDLNSLLPAKDSAYHLASVQRLVELGNGGRKKHAAYYTNRFIANELVKHLPSFGKEHIRILEPSAGAGNLLPLIFRRYEDCAHVQLDVIDIDPNSIAVLKELVARMDVPSNVSITYRVADFVTADFDCRYDLIVGNPPYARVARTAAVKESTKENANPLSGDLAEIFLEKALRLGDCVGFILNKAMLSSEDFSAIREEMCNMRISSIDDFGRCGFAGVTIETIALIVQAGAKPGVTDIYNHRDHTVLHQRQDYITDVQFPGYVIYRDRLFDDTFAKLTPRVFDVFRDRQISKRNTFEDAGEGRLWVLKGKNIDEDGKGLSHIPGYDAYIDEGVVRAFATYGYLGDTSVYLVPNMTYKPRVVRNPGDVVTDGSVAVLIPRKPLRLSDKQLSFYASDEFRRYYRIARNKSTQSINIDSMSSFYFGVVQDDHC